VDRVIELLQRRGRLSYRALKIEFDLNDARVDDLKFELIEVQGLAADQVGAILVWREPARRCAGALSQRPGARSAYGSNRITIQERPGPVTDPQAERRQLTVCSVI
jgi:hypothetical protein